MSPSRDSRATAELVSRLSEAGVQMSPRQVERWSEFGLVPDSSRQALGRGKGTAATLAPDALSRVREALEVHRNHRPLHHVTLVLFIRGHDFDVKKLRRAFARLLDEQDRILRPLEEADDPFDVAERLATEAVSSGHRTEMRAMVNRVADADESPEGIVQSAFTNLFLMASGAEIDEKAVREIVQASGLAAMESEMAGLGPVVARVPETDIVQAAGLMAAPLQRHAVEAASEEDFLLAATFLRLLGTLATEFSDYCRRLGLGRDAFGYGVLANQSELTLATFAPAILMMVKLAGWRENIRLHIEWLRLAAPQQRALNELLEALPRRYWKWARPDRSEWLSVVPDAEKKRLQDRIDSILLERPELAVALDEAIWNEIERRQSAISDLHENWPLLLGS